MCISTTSIAGAQVIIATKGLLRHNAPKGGWRERGLHPLQLLWSGGLTRTVLEKKLCIFGAFWGITVYSFTFA